MPVPPPVIARYKVKTLDPKGALTALCRGQSVGNPFLLSPYETTDFLKRWAADGTYAFLGGDYYEFEVKWPRRNFGQEGVNYLLSVILGGQCDIELFQECHLTDLNLSSFATHFPRPRYGLHGIREKLNIPTRPLIGGILKPKIGMTPHQVADVVKAMADGGCDFIKEDEILADQSWCSMKQRIPLVMKELKGYATLYAPCITGDGYEVRLKAKHAIELGATALHLNLWSSLGAYHDLRKYATLPIHFQKSGDRVWSNGKFSLVSSVLYQLVHLIGCDFAHIGMYGGYRAETVGDLRVKMQALNTTIPSFSCGMTPVLAEEIIVKFGSDLMLTSGGWIHSQPEGITRAVNQIRKVAECSVPNLTM